MSAINARSDLVVLMEYLRQMKPVALRLLKLELACYVWADSCTGPENCLALKFEVLWHELKGSDETIGFC